MKRIGRDGSDRNIIVRDLDNIAAGYAGILGAYARIRCRLVPVDAFRMVRDTITPGARVMDVGCGIGLFTMHLAKHCPDAEFVGLELNKKRVDAANQLAIRLNIHNVTFLAADMRSPEFRGAWTHVIAIDLLHHLPLSASAVLLESSHAALKKGGFLWVKDIDTQPWWKWAFTYALDLLMAPRDDYSYLSLLERQRQIKEAGFNDAIGCRLASYLPYPHYIIRACKT